MAMQYWLMKSEPSEVSIDDLSSFKQQTVEWFGIRNYQARNFMRDQMQLGDLAFFWHSSCKEPGIYGIVKIITKAHPDSLQFDLNSEYYEPKSTYDNPRWWCVDVQLVKKVKYVSIQDLRMYPQLNKMQVLQKGNRLSITKVAEHEWNFILDLIKK
jgi:predicted RNA-binding protein with PUA-like domain